MHMYRSVAIRSDMAYARSIRSITALIAVSSSILLLICYLKFSRMFVASVVDQTTHAFENREQLPVLNIETTAASVNSAANVIVPSLFDSGNETIGCKTATLMGMKFPVCHYTPETDDTVTGMLMNGKYFEADEVARFLRLLQRDSRLQLVDIGANVGLYTLPAGRLTKVLAVEPNLRTMARLAKGVHLGVISSNVTLVHNGISNVRATFNMGVHPRNQGDAFLINTTMCNVTFTNKPCNTLSAATKTITLNDLLPLMRAKSALMKIDTQGHEIYVFTNSTAGQFFDQIDVPLVFLEWVLCKQYPIKTVHGLLYFFFSRNYGVFDMNNSKLDEKRYTSWPENVLFKKPAYMSYIHF